MNRIVALTIILLVSFPVWLVGVNEQFQPTDSLTLFKLTGIALAAEFAWFAFLIGVVTIVEDLRYEPQRMVIFGCVMAYLLSYMTVAVLRAAIGGSPDEVIYTSSYLALVPWVGLFCCRGIVAYVRP